MTLMTGYIKLIPSKFAYIFFINSTKLKKLGNIKIMTKPEQKDFVFFEMTVLISKFYFILISITKNP